ncbi:MAG: exosome complex RNA-binding protein Rrp4 [Candidatus Hadarchaeales archaeon]
MIHVQDRGLVVPGDLLAEGNYRVGTGAYREGGRVYSSVVGLASVSEREIKVVPLQGPYIPAPGDNVIGIVVDIHYSGWILDINSPYTGNLFISDFLHRKADLAKEAPEEYLGVGDTVLASVREVDERMRVLLETEGPRSGKIVGGKMIEIAPVKIPRVLGKKGSMLDILKKVGRCRLIVGQNGRIVVYGDDQRAVDAVVRAIFMIEREAHTTGLTDRVRLMLERETMGM